MLSAFKEYIQSTFKQNLNNRIAEANIETTAVTKSQYAILTLGMFYFYMAFINSRDVLIVLKEWPILNGVININPLENNPSALLKQKYNQKKEKYSKLYHHRELSFSPHTHNINVVRSQAKDGSEKQWIEKLRSFSYALSAAAREVFFGQLAVAILGKNVAPKTKFDLEKLGIVSRVIGDDINKTSNLDTASSHNVVFSAKVQEELLRAICYSYVIEDNDLSCVNLVVKYDEAVNWEKNTLPNAETVYSIDHEHASKSNWIDWIGGLAKNVEWFKDVLQDCSNIRHSVWGYRSEQHLGQISNAHIRIVLKQIVDDITANDYLVCQTIRQKIYEDLNKPESVYSYFAINYKIMPSIDSAIQRLKSNVNNLKNAFLQCAEEDRYNKAKITSRI